MMILLPIAFVSISSLLLGIGSFRAMPPSLSYNRLRSVPQYHFAETQRLIKTYSEATIPEDVAERGINLVQPLANILERRGAKFYNKTTDQDWEKAEKELGFRLPPDYKMLCNTIGTAGSFAGGNWGLQTPIRMVERAKYNREAYKEWQVDTLTQEGVQTVGIMNPGDPGFHLEWALDVEGNAMSFFWIVTTPPNPDRWPTVRLALDDSLRAWEAMTYPATVTEILYREVVDQQGETMEELLFQYSDMEEHELLLGSLDKHVLMNNKPVYRSNWRNPERILSLPTVGSDRDKEDQTVLKSAGFIEPIDTKKGCTETGVYRSLNWGSDELH